MEEKDLRQIPDDPIIRCMERWGYPPWLCGGFIEEDEEVEDDGQQKKTAVG